jgi:hypothetical protein
MVSLSNHELAAVRRAHCEAMGDIIMAAIVRHHRWSHCASINCQLKLPAAIEAGQVHNNISGERDFQLTA